MRLNPYTFHISLYDLALLVAISVVLNFALLLWFTRKTNRAANRFLVGAIACVALSVTHVLAIDIGLKAYIPSFSLAFAPLIFLYVRNLTQVEYKFGWKDLLHFIPVVLAQFAVSNPELSLLIFISTAIYLYLCHRLVERFYQGKAFNDGDRHRLELRWLRRLLTGLGLLWLLSIPFVVTGNYQPLYLILMSVLIGLAAHIYLKPEEGAASALKPLLPAELKQKAALLKKAVKEKRYYQDPELSLSLLAEKLGLTAHELSRVLNSALKKSFNDFINEYRVQEAAQKMQDPAHDHMTLLGIAYESGFNSQSTFTRTFKLMTGKTPLEYKNALKKESSTYNLGSPSRFAPVILHRETTPLWSLYKVNRIFMFRNYLKMAWRNTLHNKVYSALNIVGLAAGMAVALLIGLWVTDQYLYDRFLPGYEQSYQVEMNLTSQHDGTHTQTAIPLPLLKVLREEIPGIKYVAESDDKVRLIRLLSAGDKKLYLDGASVGTDFFKILQYPFVKGNANSALKDIHSIVLTESTAKALFGDADPMGKTVQFDNSQDMKVTGVIKDIPKNATLHFDYLRPFPYLVSGGQWKEMGEKWTDSFFSAYVALEPGVNYAQIAPKIRDIVSKRSQEMRALKPEIMLQPLKDWHLYNEFKNGKVVGGFIEYVRLFSIIGILVLVIACINFMNLSTARSEKRAREVGVRKAIGSSRMDLVYQFLLESIMITSLSFLLCLLFVTLALPSFNALTGSYTRIPYGSLGFWCIMIAFVLATGLAAGSRPAFYLSSFNPAKVLKGAIQAGKAAVLPRKILVVVQFTCSVALIISTVIVYQQIQYVKDRPIGYDPDRLVRTNMNGDIMEHMDALKNELLTSNLVESVSWTSQVPTEFHSGFSLDRWPGKTAGEQSVNIAGIAVADGYFRTLGMTFAAGRDFGGDWKNDSLNVIVNEATVRRIGLKDPINQLINININPKPVRIIGVVKDAVMASPYKPVEPAFFLHNPGGGVLTYRLPKNADPHATMEKIARVFKKYCTAYPYEYKFVDTDYAAKFSLEVLIGKLAGVFAALAIFISCLGLFGLAAYVAEQRTKEIGIRKVLGASITQVWLMLSRDFLVLVGISCVIASPIAFYYLHGWLEKYTYRVSIGVGVFVASGLAAIIITLLTISFQAIKAALANPVDSLRSE